MPKQPMRIFDGVAEPHTPFWRVQNAAGAEPEIEFYGYISEYSWFDDDITPKMFREDLYAAGKGGSVTIRMNSGGGDVIAASVIRSILMEYPGTVTVRIDGLCASAATFVAMAGDRVRMQDTAYWMIHDPSAIAWGTIEEIKAVIDLLKTIKSGIVDAYQAKTGIGTEKLSKLMTDETWMTAKQAQEMGFIDEVITEKQTRLPANMAIVNALSNYQHVPAALVDQLKPDTPHAEPPDVARLRAEVKILA